MAAEDTWIKQKSAGSLQPATVEMSLREIAQQWPHDAPPLEQVIDQFPLGQAELLHLLAISSICATRLKRNPETLLWLANPDVCLSRRGAA